MENCGGLGFIRRLWISRACSNKARKAQAPAGSQAGPLGLLLPLLQPSSTCVRLPSPGPGPFHFQNQQPSPHTPVSPSFLTLCKARVPCLSETPFPGTLCACALGRLQMGPGCDAPTVSVPPPPSDGSFPGQGLGQPIKVRRF